MQPKRAIAFGMSGNFAFAVASVMQDLNHHSSRHFDEFVIFHDGISECDKEIIQSIFPTRFIHYSSPFVGTRVMDMGYISQFTPMVFSKFEALSLLREYESVVWLDYDIVILEDLEDLFQPTSRGIKVVAAGRPVEGNFKIPVPGYDMGREGMSAGTIFFSRDIGNFDLMYDYCLSKTLEMADILYMPEQAIFDLMIQDFSLSPEILANTVYVPHPKTADGNALILHAYGVEKFWHGLDNIQWNKNYSWWISEGGSPYKPPNIIEKISRNVSRANRTLRRKLLGPFR
jgi:lipopolysaccharide biosynthesis glycosyltransferase